MTVKRCEWANSSESMAKYHDEEWGQPLHNDQKLFEILTLEIMQAGLSWSIVLNKRDGFNKAFDHFDINGVKDFDDSNIKMLIKDKNIIRNEPKIKATIANAKAIIKIQKEFGSFDKYLWGFVDNKPIVHDVKSMSDVPSKDELSIKLSKDMKHRGFKFTGPVTIYSFMQAIGMINDHVNDCFKKKQKVK